MLRRRLREEIRAVASGEFPEGIARSDSATIKTYGQDLLLRVPRAATPAQDREVLKKLAREVIDAGFQQPPMLDPSFRV